MKILLTGSSGFIGKTFLRRFGDRYDITPYDIVGGKDIGFLGCECEWK